MYKTVTSPLFLSGSVATYLVVRQFSLYQISVLIISNWKGEKFVKIGKKNKYIYHKNKSGVVFFILLLTAAATITTTTAFQLLFNWPFFQRLLQVRPGTRRCSRG